MKTKLIITSLMIFTGLTWLSGQTSSGSTDKTSQSLQVTLYDLGSEQYQNLSLNDILNKYKGKVVYLDFWASWCGPCKREMPYSQKLKKQFKGRDVVFLYFSTDNNAEKWEKAIKQMHINGINYRANPKVRNEIVREFNLQYIPRYILIDKNGKVTDYNAKRPSNPMIAQDIEKLL
ncbi:MAG TPA: TlpA family protein disulfide reductase [Bacteroidetes bacterium]|nr:TlpA family protein disulfide reductase [Bacteroidota bacterium]